jgi:flagellar basal body P-ring formation protein FlgA
MKLKYTEKYYWFFTASSLVFFFFLSSVGQVLANEAKPTQTIKAGEIERRGTEFLWERISEIEDDFEVKAIFSGRDVVLPEGKIDFEFEILGQSRRLKARRIPFLLNIIVDGESKKKLRLNSQAKFYKEVVTSTRRLEKGTIVTSDDLDLIRVDALRVNKRTFVNPDEVIGLMAIRDINNGQVLKLNMVRKPAVVKRGDRVLIMAKMGAMKITAPGLVKEKGFKGSMIRVQNIQSKKEVYGRVLDSKTVEVNF